MALATKKIIQALLYSREFVTNIETQSEGGYEKKTERHARIWSICDARQATIYTANIPYFGDRNGDGDGMAVIWLSG